MTAPGATDRREIDALAPEIMPGIRVLPVIHGRVDMASVVRGVLLALEPAGVAVELPHTWGPWVDQAVARLPLISVLLSEPPGPRSGAGQLPPPSLEGQDEVFGEEAPSAWIVAPGDPFVEALRWARENGRPRFLVDLDLPYRERHEEPVPDPYAMWSLGPAAYLEPLLEIEAGRRRRGTPTGMKDLSGQVWDGDEPRDQDETRERVMAFHAQNAARSLPGGVLVVLVGGAHARALGRLLQRPLAQPLVRSRPTRVELRHLHPKSLTGVLVDPPLAHAAFELLRRGPVAPPPPLDAVVPAPVSLVRHGLRLITSTASTASTASTGSTESQSPDGDCRARRIAEYAAWWGHRHLWGNPIVDRRKLTGVVWRLARGAYERLTRESLSAWQRRLFFDFARRYTRVQGLLVAGLYEWVVGARGVADDNLAWEALDVAQAYGWQSTEAEIPTAEIDGDLLDLGTRTVRFRRRSLRVKRRLVPVRSRPKMHDPQEWLRGFDAGGLCSFPPEDLVIEDYGRFLQHKAVSILSTERSRSEPFTTSFLDGIDLRETLRNLGDGKIYVRESGRCPGQAGSVAVIFDADLDGTRYPYLMTWHGESSQESDMGFYSTHPAEHVVGPGIMRATYGGFFLTYPPQRLFDIWQDPDYAVAENKPEVLIMAAIDYSLQKIIVHVAERPPAPRLHSYSHAQGKRLVHIPLGTLSPVALKKIRVLHLLVGRDKREIARDYLW